MQRRREVSFTAYTVWSEGDAKQQQLLSIVSDMKATSFHP